MAHEHGSEYQVRIVHEDETEELSGWMNGQEEVTRAITGLRWSPDKAYWLRVRNILCSNCQHQETPVVESRLILTAGENTRFPPQTERRLLGFASSRTSSAGA